MNTPKNISTLFSLILLVVLFDISSLYSAWSTLADYDSSKVKVALLSSTTYVDFQSRLNFITGIGIQMYVYDHLFDWSVGGVRLVCNCIFLLAIVFAAYKPSHFSVNDQFRFPISALICIALLLLFNTNAIAYLKTYGMFVYVEMVLMGVILGLMMREAPEELFYTKRVLLYSGITLSFIMVLFDPRFLPFFWGALSLYLLVWWPFLRNKYRVAIFITVLLALVPFVASLYLTPHVLDFRPAHTKAYFFATSGQGDILLYLKSVIESLYEMTFQSALYLFLSLLCCCLSKFILQKRASIVLIGFVVLIPLGAFIASLLDLYPFGHIRYLLPWFGVLLVLVSTGIWGGVKLLIVELGRWNKADSFFVLSVFACIALLLASSLPVSFVKVTKAASISNASKDFYASLKTFNKDISICDAPSAVILKAHGLSCNVNIGWRYQQGVAENITSLNENLSLFNSNLEDFEKPVCIFFASFKNPNSEYYMSYVEGLRDLGYVLDISEVRRAKPSPFITKKCW